MYASFIRVVLALILHPAGVAAAPHRYPMEAYLLYSVLPPSARISWPQM